MNDPIVEALRAERERRVWTQKQLGQKLGRSTHQTIWVWENGANEPKLSSLRAWAKALGFDVVLVPSGEREER
jgi:transcriptional regulator with XRE-family HTH domain